MRECKEIARQQQEEEQFLLRKRRQKENARRKRFEEQLKAMKEMKEQLEGIHLLNIIIIYTDPLHSHCIMYCFNYAL